MQESKNSVTFWRTVAIIALCLLVILGFMYASGSGTKETEPAAGAAVEETAATPTGNQAMQRCERQYGSAHLRIPYWYFVSEYGEHVDGGVRRDNIWPSIAAIKLTLIKNTPCLVLHYSDIDNVEDYNSGNGLGLLFSSLSHIIDNYVCGKSILDQTEELLASQYQEMLPCYCFFRNR